LALTMTPRALVIAALLALAAAAPAAAYDPAAEADNYSKVGERFSEYGTAEYQLELRRRGAEEALRRYTLPARDPERTVISLCASHEDGCAGDVRMYDWGEKGRGFVQPVEFVNRNGAVITGHLWAAFARRAGVVRRRAVISITNGSVQAPEVLYWHIAQTLAQRGYVVMTWDPQGQGQSDTLGAGADLLRGVPAQQAPNFYEGTEEALDFLFSTPDQPYEPRVIDGAASNAEAAAKQRRRVAEGRSDAYNPLHGLVNLRRVGIAGHSLGAAAVSQVGTEDARVDAIVAWDNLRAPEGLAPRVPALGVSNDYGLTPTPFTSDPDPEAKNAAFATYRAAGVDAMEVSIRGGTHYESSYIPNPAFGATLRGIDLVDWYTAAWFDKHVKRRGERADRMLTSDRWLHDERGAAVDPAGDGNLFSFYFRSVADFGLADGGRFACEDLRAGCGGSLTPRAQDGHDGEWSYLEERLPR
jgi:alpha-beta hydrolase superfamily lysophospholipase